MRSDKINGINNLKGAKYCHPGNVFENLLITNYILYEFERKVLREKGFTNKLCDGKSDQYLEDYFKTLAEYFGQSCRPIQTADKNFNAYIEDKFPSLVASCEERNDFETALRCLVHKGGDIAVTTLNEYNNFFTQPENQNSKQYFKFLCKDGNTAADPCFWTKQPWELIVSERCVEREKYRSTRSILIRSRIITSSKFGARTCTITYIKSELQKSLFLTSILFINLIFMHNIITFSHPLR